MAHLATRRPLPLPGQPISTACSVSDKSPQGFLLSECLPRPIPRCDDRLRLMRNAEPSFALKRRSRLILICTPRQPPHEFNSAGLSPPFGLASFQECSCRSPSETSLPLLKQCVARCEASRLARPNSNANNSRELCLLSRNLSLLAVETEPI